MISRHLSVGKIFTSYFLQRRRSWPSCSQQAYCIDRRLWSDRIGRLFSGVRVFLRHPARKLGVAVQLACSLFLQCLACLLNLAALALHFLARVRQQTRPLLQLFIGPL